MISSSLRDPRSSQNPSRGKRLREANAQIKGPVFTQRARRGLPRSKLGPEVVALRLGQRNHPIHPVLELDRLYPRHTRDSNFCMRIGLPEKIKKRKSQKLIADPVRSAYEYFLGQCFFGSDGHDLGSLRQFFYEVQRD